jgi:Na+/phosphate symporter
VKPRAPKAPTNTRKLRDDLNRRLFWLVLFVLVIVGGGLIAAIYGSSAAVLGLACLLVGAGVIGLVWAIFTLIGKWVGED